MVNQRVSQAQRVTVVGFVVNLILTVGKIVAGVVGRSSAMLADGVHSLSDFVTDVVVLVFIRVSGKEPDSTHAYGHGKFETFATLLISAALLLVGVGIFADAAMKIADAVRGEVLPEPKMIALWAALVSIVSKEALFQYTIRVGRRIQSQAVIANGWHHRSDAFSSIGTAIGISGAIFLGPQWRVLDPIAGLVVSVFIAKVALDLGRPSIDELLERSLPDDVCQQIVDIIMATPSVVGYHKLRTRKIGNAIAVDVHIQIDRSLSFEASHDVTRQVEHSLREVFGVDSQFNIHAEPKAA